MNGAACLGQLILATRGKNQAWFLASSISTTGSVMTLRIQIETSRFYIDIGSRSSGSTNSTRSIMVRTNIISSWIRQQISKSIIIFGSMASSLLRLHSDWVCGLWISLFGALCGPSTKIWPKAGFGGCLNQHGYLNVVRHGWLWGCKIFRGPPLLGTPDWTSRTCTWTAWTSATASALAEQSVTTLAWF